MGLNCHTDCLLFGGMGTGDQDVVEGVDFSYVAKEHLVSGQLSKDLHSNMVGHELAGDQRDDTVHARDDAT